MLKKTSDDAKNTPFFSLIFHRFFEKNQRKIVQKEWKPALCTKIDEKARSERRFLAKNRFLGSPRVPRAVPGQPGKFTKSFIFLIHGELRPKTSPGGLREASGRPWRSPQAPSGYDFASIFGSILHVKNKRKHTKSVENNSKNLEELVTLIRATVNS